MQASTGASRSGSPVATCCCGTPFYVSPLYIYWLAFAQALTGASVAGVLVLQAALGTLAVWLTARTAALWVPDDRRVRAAVVAGGALALTGIVALQEALILQSALDAVLMSAFAYAFTRALQQPSPRAWAWCGVALALLATNRPNAWLLGAIVAMCAWRRGGARRAGPTFAIGAIASTDPTFGRLARGELHGRSVCSSCSRRSRSARPGHRRMAGAAGAWRTELLHRQPRGRQRHVHGRRGDPAVDRGPARGHAPGCGTGRGPSAVGRCRVVALRPAVARLVATRARRCRAACSRTSCG